MAIEIWEQEKTVALHCKVCGETKIIDTDVSKFAYREINKFRGEHEHFEGINEKSIKTNSCMIYNKCPIRFGRL